MFKISLLLGVRRSRVAIATVNPVSTCSYTLYQVWTVTVIFQNISHLLSSIFPHRYVENIDLGLICTHVFRHTLSFGITAVVTWYPY